jgi:uroporphyrinogen-III synthase
MHIILTRAKEDCYNLRELLVKHAFSVSIIPCVERKTLNISREELESFFDFSGGENSNYWLVFSSSYGVECLSKYIADLPDKIKIAVQGETTMKSLEQVYRRKADLLPIKSNAEALSEALKKEVSSDDHILLIQPENARPTLFEKLSRSVKSCQKISLYRTSATLFTRKERNYLSQLKSGVVIFYSPSAVDSFVEQMPAQDLSKFFAISLGPVTSQQILIKELKLLGEAEEQSDLGVLDLMLRLVKQSNIK